jgi:hypothetical protein
MSDTSAAVDPLDGSDKNLPVPVDRKGVAVLAPPARIDLSNYRDIRLEMARVYRAFDQQKIGESEAKARHFMLSTLAQIIKATETEQRLEAIERAMNMRRAADRETNRSQGLPPYGRGFGRRQ